MAECETALPSVLAILGMRSYIAVLRRFPSLIAARCLFERRRGRLRRSDRKHNLGPDAAPRPVPIFLPVRPHSQSGIDTLTAAVGRDAPHHGSGCKAALPPDSKRLGPKCLEDGARQKMALDVKGVLDGGMDRQEALS